MLNALAFKILCQEFEKDFFIKISSKTNNEKKKAHNFGQCIGVEKDLSVIEPHTIHFENNFESFI